MSSEKDAAKRRRMFAHGPQIYEFVLWMEARIDPCDEWHTCFCNECEVKREICKTKAMIEGGKAWN